jgi:hypothetical protein
MEDIKTVKDIKDITLEGFYYVEIDGEIQFCYYWKDCDSLEIIKE